MSKPHLFPHQRRELALRLAKKPHIGPFLAKEYEVDINTVYQIKRKWKLYLELESYFHDLAKRYV